MRVRKLSEHVCCQLGRRCAQPPATPESQQTRSVQDDAVHRKHGCDWTDRIKVTLTIAYLFQLEEEAV